MKVSGLSFLGAKDNFSDPNITTTSDPLFATVTPQGPNRNGLNVNALGVYRDGLADRALLATAGALRNQIGFGLAHGALKGDMIRFTNLPTTNAIENTEVFVKRVIDATTVEIYGTLSADVNAADTVDILKPVTPRMTVDGASVASLISPPIQINVDTGAGPVATTVLDDQATPANTVPVPVRLYGVSGNITITSEELNVQLSHSAASPDSVRIGDGTNLMAVNASLEALTAPNGRVADNAPDTTNPIKVGSRFNAAPPTYTDGDVADLQSDINGRLVVVTSDIQSLEKHDLDTGAGTEDNLGVSLRLSANGGSIEAIGQLARATSIPVTLSTEDITLVTEIRDRLPATIGQKADAASLAVTLSTEQDAIITAIRDRLPTSVGQKARAASLSTTFSTEDLAVVTAIRDRLPTAIGQQAEAASLSVTLSTENEIVLISIDDKLPATLGQKANAASLAVTLSSEQETIITAIQDRLPLTLGQKTKAASLAVTMASDQEALSKPSYDVLVFTTLDLGASPVTDAAYVELIASVGGTAIKAIQIFTSTGTVMRLALGPGAGEADKMIVPPGGMPGHIMDVAIPAATRVSLRAVAGQPSANAGIVTINFLG